LNALSFGAAQRQLLHSSGHIFKLQLHAGKLGFRNGMLSFSINL